MAMVFGDHGGYCHYTHNQKDGEEDNCDNQYRHTAPLPALCFGAEQESVTAITARREVEHGADEGRGIFCVRLKAVR
jgi:hypothetical protein